MSRVGKIARRTFLIGSAAIAGGVVFGYYKYKQSVPNPLLPALDAGEAALTPYVRIDADGVTIITPRAEMGQGAHSVLAAMVAEELDVAWEDLRVDHGPPSSAYYNGAVMGDGMPFAATDDGFIARNARAFGDVVGKFMSLQITGGSSTVPDGFDKMRMAGAVARMALIGAAAAQTSLPASDLRTEDGAVVLPDGTRLSYSTLAEAAAAVDLPDAVTLKPQADWRYLGKSLPRLDVVAKSTGKAIYGIDLRLPGMVHATVRANPRLGGGVQSFDATQAEAARGVLKVVPVTGGVGVIADNTWRAFQAAGLIDIAWGPAPHLATSDLMWAEVEASFTDDRRDSRFRDDGDVEARLTGAGTITAEYRVPYLAHAPLEPMTAVAQWDEGRLQIWAGTQIPMQVLATASKLTGLSAEDIHLTVLPMGGSFGRRLEDDFIAQAIELAQAYPGVPVSLTWSREEDMTHDFPRPMGMARMRGAVADGKVAAYDGAIAMPSVTASQTGRMGLSVPGPDIAIVAGAWDQPFAIPDYRVTGYGVPNLAPVSSWRSVGASANGFFHDSFLDELIHTAGADPMEERIRLCTHDASRNVLEAVAEMSGWGAAMPPGTGRGVAFCLSFGVPCAQVVEVTDTGQGIRIDKVWAAVDVGIALDPANIEAQVSGGIIWGLGHAMNCEITYDDGMPEQDNYHLYEGMRMSQVPQIEVRVLETLPQIKGIGEPGVPPAAAALANAIYAATGQRHRELPLARTVVFV